ncbi:MAG TPA: hypothetical protein VK622_07480 [Puia sp.]|nr:hypothetical protein [Puia sp.]
MILKKQPLPAFVLENKFFDQLTNINDIALYAIIARLDGIPWSNDLIIETFKIPRKSFDKSIKRLIEVGVLELNKEI